MQYEKILKKAIKKNLKSLTVYKIMNTETGLFKVSGYTTECSKIGKSWYKIGDVKKAFNLVPTDKDKYKIVKFKIKVNKIKIL